MTWPPSALPRKLDGGPGICRFCGQAIIWGETNKGRTAPFDAEPPFVNHWITCPERKQAAKVYKR